MSNSTLVFDFGGVITPRQRSALFSDWAAATFGADRAAVHRLFNGPVGSAYSSGRMRCAEFYGRVAELGVRGDPEELAAVLVSFNAPDAGMLALLEELRAKGRRLCLVSDGMPELCADVRRRVGHLFDVLVFSSEEGCLKRDRVLFDIAFRRIGDPTLCTYIDDRAENLVYPGSLGAACLLFEGELPLRRALGSWPGADPRAPGRS